MFICLGKILKLIEEKQLKSFEIPDSTLVQ